MPFDWKSPSNGDVDWSARQFMIHYYDDGSWDEKELAILVNMETFSTDYTLPQGRSWTRIMDTQSYYDMDGTNGESQGYFNAAEDANPRVSENIWLEGDGTMGVHLYCPTFQHRHLRGAVIMSIVLGLIGLLGQSAEAAPVQVGGYMRVMTRPDVQGGNFFGILEFLYGRLLNERGYTMLDTRVQPKKPILWRSLEQCSLSGRRWIDRQHRRWKWQSFQLSIVTGLLVEWKQHPKSHLAVGNTRELFWRLGTLRHETCDGIYRHCRNLRSLSNRAF